MDESTIYIEYKKMRKRERELLREHKQLEKEYGKDENFIESLRRLKIIRKKLNQIAEAKKFLKEKDTRYCARCKKSTKKGTLDAKYIGRVEYCKVCHSTTKNGKVCGEVRLGATFKNDFARHLLNDYGTSLEYFSAEDIIGYLRNGVMQMDRLPPNIAKEVREELERTGIDLQKKLRKSKKYFTEQMKMDEFSINDIIDSLNHGFLQLDKLPPKIAKQVQKELDN